MRRPHHPLTRKRALTFVLDGEPRTADIGAPMPVERNGAWMVSLMDLWVATMLPGDIFDLSFRMVTGVASETDPACEVDGMLFAHGFIDIATRQLWWSDGAPSALVGACPRTILVTSHAQPVRTHSPPARTTPATAPRLSVVDLRRLLPIASTRYPAIEWRDATGTG
jgi:hypothetical protein